jgi:hypothetical protein
MQITRGAAVPLDCTLSALDDAGKLAKVLLGPPEDDSGAPRARGSRQAKPAASSTAA